MKTLKIILFIILAFAVPIFSAYVLFSSGRLGLCLLIIVVGGMSLGVLLRNIENMKK